MCQRLGVSAFECASHCLLKGELAPAGFPPLAPPSLPCPVTVSSGYPDHGAQDSDRLALEGAREGGLTLLPPSAPRQGLATCQRRARVSAHLVVSRGRARRQRSQCWAGSTMAHLAGNVVGACHLLLTQVPRRWSVLGDHPSSMGWEAIGRGDQLPHHQPGLCTLTLHWVPSHYVVDPACGTYQIL